jgi:hypothetical protein
MTSPSRLSPDERALIADIALLNEAAESARNLEKKDASRVRNVIFERLERLLFELETSCGHANSVSAQP